MAPTCRPLRALAHAAPAASGKQLVRRLTTVPAKRASTAGVAQTANAKEALPWALAALGSLGLIVAGALLCGSLVGTLAGILLILLGVGAFLFSAYLFLLSVSPVLYH